MKVGRDFQCIETFSTGKNERSVFFFIVHTACHSMP